MTKLELMLKYVSEHNDFYKKRIKEYGIKDPLDITQWPVLTRKELQENRYNMFSDGYKSKFFNHQLHRQSSSGSCGIPVYVYWDYKDWYASNMPLWRKRLKWYGIKPSDKYAMFTMNALETKNNGEAVHYINQPSNILSVNVSLIQNDNKYDKLVDIINNYQPKWLYIQPIVLNKLIQAYKRTGKNPPKTLKYIESVGELLTSNLKRRTIEFFKVPFANMYGSEEMNCIALENHQNQLKVMEDNVYVEVLNHDIIQNNGTGSCVITNIHNYAMPIIRYELGDLVQLNGDTIELILGRKNEVISVSHDVEINPIILFEIMSCINNQFDGIITSYRFIYNKKQNTIICKAGIEKNKSLWFHKIKETIIKSINEKLRCLNNLTFIVEQEMDDSFPHGKRKLIEVI